MTEEIVYLKPNVVIEPLIERWYAWTHLISPATAALNVVGRHLKIMNSYIHSPQIHAAAVKNPKMLGGPFMDYPLERVADIKLLKETTLHDQDMIIKLAEAISELELLLKTRANGFSLEILYDQVPLILQGYVELFYDLNNNPGYRFFESLLYRSEFYREKSQSIALWVTNNDERPFCLSTPRLDNADILHLEMPFKHPAIDALSRMKREGGHIGEAAQLMNVAEKDLPLFQSFFSKEKPQQYARYEGTKARMRYFGHACILLETNDVAILVDPLISYYGYPTNVNHFSDIDLPDSIDYVIITHNHQDHILFETLLPLRHKVKNIIVPASGSGKLEDPSLKLAFENIGFSNVIELDEMEEIKFNDCTITGLPFTGEHCDLNIKSKLCYHITIHEFSFLFMADSRVIAPELYRHIQKVIGNVDIVFLGMECDGAPLSWLYGPLLPEALSRDKDQSRRLSGSDFKKGIHLVDIFQPREVYVYAMGQEPWLEHISTIRYTEESNPIIQSDMLVAECRKRGIVAERLFGEKELFY